MSDTTRQTPVEAAREMAIDGDFVNATDPFLLFQSWFKDAEAAEVNDPNAMALASVDARGLPNIRVVLLKGLDQPERGPDRGFVFYTNLTSVKGDELRHNGLAALNFHWKSLRRQVRIRGRAEVVSDQEADAYFASRPKGSQIGAWASRQSRALAARSDLEGAIAELTEKYGNGPVPRPPHWSGYRVSPLQIEFWHDRPYRLHDRVLFSREEIGAAWSRTRLYP